jgi:L-ascorbate metabolism protein UlaG (beta-lactamase superfamily)
MSERATYLKPSVVLEPLYQRWYAWPHLISPATAAMNVLHRHLPIMNSFIDGPAVHERFSRNPKMLGAPYMSHAASRVGDVRALRDRTLRDHGQMIELAEAVRELTTLLLKNARGYALDDVYPLVPEPLQGYVELFYDLDNHPAFRFFESLLYRSRYYDVSAQSVALYLSERDERPFVLSTPRLDEETVLHLRVPFTAPGLDALFAMRAQAGSYERVRELLGITAAQEPLFRGLFTEEAPRSRGSHNGGGVHVRYFSHACILLECDGVSILTDPVISSREDTEILRYTYADLPEHIDYVVITHNHQDHVLLETLIQLRHKIGTVIVPRNSGGSLQDPSLKLMFEALGFRNVFQLDELQSVELRGCTVTGLPFVGEHADLNIHSKLGYHVRMANGFRVLFAADSCNLEPKLNQYVHDMVGDANMLFLGMECDGAPLSWLYGPLMPERLSRSMDHSRRLAGSNCAQGMELVTQFRPEEVYVYAMGQEPWLRHIMALEYTRESHPIVASDDLIGACRARGIVAERLFGREELNRG